MQSSRTKNGANLSLFYHRLTMEQIQDRYKSPHTIQRRIDGYVLIELLVSTGVISTVALTLYLTLFNLIHSQTLVKEIYQELYCYFRFKTILREVAESLDQHRLQLLPRVHQQNIIRFTDNTPNQIMNTAANRAPAIGSNALSFIEVDLLNTHDVTTLTQNNNLIEAHACPRFNQKFNTQNYRSFVGLNLDGMMEFRGSAKSGRARKPCRLFSLTPVNKSMLLETHTKFRSANITVIVPIVRQTTYYLDKNGEARSLAHEGDRNIENQPLFSEVHSIRFHLHPVLNGSIFLISGKITFPSKRSYTSSVVSHLGRNNHFNFLLNTR